MADEKHEPERNGHPRQKWLPVAAILLLVLLAAGFGVRYVSFVSRTIYQESTSHLEEVLHKSNNMLKEMVRKNLTYLHLYNGFLENTSDEDEIQTYIEAAQQNTGFADFYFLTYDGNYMTVTGETGYLGLQTNLDEKLAHDEDVVVNTALPGKPQMLAFICPETQGSYRGFAYDAIAISYYNDAVLRLLDNSAFEGNASNYVIYPDGRVVIDNSVNRKEAIYNFLATLRDHSDLSEEQILALSDAFAQGSSGNLKVKLGDTSYYLVYEGTAVQNWTMVGLVPVSIVNASLDQLWFYTVQIVAGIVLGFAVLIILLIARRSHTTLRRKDTEIRYRDVLFQKLSLNVDDVFLMLDAETSTVDYVSPNIGRLLGIPWRNVRQDVHALVALYPKDDPDRDKNFLEGLHRGEQREWDAAYLHQETREPRWFHIVAMSSEVEGKTKYILVMSDRTADKQVNQALSDAVAAAETANRAKSTFLSNMSHDIRTPMNAIVGLTAIAGANIESQDRVIECLSKITKSSRHLLGLINEVLDMARIESGKMTLAQEDFNLPDLVDNLITLTKPVIDEHKHNLDIHINHIEHGSVCGDSLRIQQVFVNLMSNAVKYTPDGGNITFSIEEKPNGFSELGCYEFTIEDNGIGMSPEFQKIMFDPFSRADDHRTTRVQGTGLGMTISRNIVNLMNGNIKVESTLHKGTKITVTIYLELQEKEKEQDRNLMNLPVLVVDDDKICCESTVATLKEIGITGEWVLSGREAVERCYAHHELKNDYFAVILDWKMPDMDGIETARQIRKRIGKEITIIVLTSYEFSEIEEEAKAAGVDAFIAKPLFRSRLTATLRQFTSGRKEKTARNYLDELSEADYTGKRILLVEDNELNREIAVEILQMTGAEVETAENGKIAVEKVEASPKGLYDLIFMDIQMPVMNGYEATAAIRSLPGENGKLPIVAMTANAFAEDVQLAKNTGMNGHIAKPLDMNKLKDVLGNCL